MEDTDADRATDSTANAETEGTIDMNPSDDQIRRWAADPAQFRADAMIKAGGQVCRYGDVENEFQRVDHAAMDPAWQRLIGQYSGPVDHRLAYLERGRGHSKTTDMALSVAYPLIFSTQPIFGLLAGGDIDQGAIMKRQMAVFASTMPWIKSRFQVQRNCIVNPETGSRVEIISSDVATSWGQLFDFCICDEISVWPASGEGLWHSLFSASDKQDDRCVMIIISNAGTGKGSSWQWKLREDARTHDDWYFHSLAGPTASWWKPAAIDRQKRLLPEPVFNRVIMNVWCSTSGDALTEELLSSATDHTYQPPTGKQRGWRYGAGLDIGYRRDGSAFVVNGCRPQSQLLELQERHSWLPRELGHDVDLSEVEETIYAAHRRYGLGRVLYDPFQAELLAQRLRKRGVPMESYSFAGKNLTALASNLLDAFRSGLVKLYPCPLIDDLRRLGIAETSWGGYKLTAERSAFGHCDEAIAYALSVTACKDLPMQTGGTWGGVIPQRAAVIGRRGSGSFGSVIRQPGSIDIDRYFDRPLEQYINRNT
jgi:hypothetical protein